MLGKLISMTAHVLGMATILGCAVAAQQMTASSLRSAGMAQSAALGGEIGPSSMTWRSR